jgi:hypothetical protein
MYVTMDLMTILAELRFYYKSYKLQNFVPFVAEIGALETILINQFFT